MGLQSLIQLLGDSCGPTADPVIGNPNSGRMPDDAASIERGELGRNAPDEVPGRTAAGEEIWHGSPAVLDEMLAIFAPTR